MQPLRPEHWDDSLRHVVDDMGGRPLNIHQLMANHPPLLAAWWPLRNYLVNGGDLDQRHTELAILCIAARLHCSYEWGAHVDRGLAAGLTGDEIEAVRRGDFHAFDAPTTVMLAAVRQLLEGYGVTGATRDRLERFFTPTQILDLIALCGMYVTLANMIGTWDLDLDGFIRERLPAGSNIDNFTGGME